MADLSDMRSLSGGERSFSTVCFVLSLWAITEAPFRCLDEFDVYMVIRSFYCECVCVCEALIVNCVLCFA